MDRQNPHLHNLKLIASMVPAMRYDGSKPFSAWQKDAREKLSALLGLPTFVKCEPCFTIEYQKELENATEIRFAFQSEEGYFVPCHLLIPKGANKPLPVVICLQGHSTGMHISMGRAKFEEDANLIGAGDRDFALRIVKEGYCALVIEQRNFGECSGNEDGKGPNCHCSSMAALLIGRTTLGERVWDISRAIDMLEQNFTDYYNGECICMGNSGGGTATFYAACLDTRICAAMPSCAVCSFDDSIAAMRHCVCNFVPGIRKFFDMGDMAGLIAPRPLVMVAGKEDEDFPLDGVMKSFELAKRLYKNADAEDACALVVGNGGHRFYADDAWPVMHKMLEQ